MSSPLALALAAALALPAVARAADAAPPAGAAAAPAPKAAAKGGAADTDRALYAIGLSVARELAVFRLSPAELEKVLKGIRDANAGKPRFTLDPASQQAIQALATARLAAAAAQEKTRGAAYLEKMSRQPGAVKTESGAIVIPVKAGTGASPTAADKVKVHYTGKLVDGKVFDSSVQRGQPAEFPLGSVIKCWTEGMQRLKVGGRATIVCPSAIAYGEQGRPPLIPGNAVLTFDVELLDIVK